MGGEATQMERVERSVLGLVDLERRLTLGAIRLGGPKGQGGPLVEELSRGTRLGHLLAINRCSYESNRSA